MRTRNGDARREGRGFFRHAFQRQVGVAAAVSLDSEPAIAGARGINGRGDDRWSDCPGSMSFQ